MKHIFRVIILILALTLIIPSANPVVIIVHGSFSSQNGWWRVGGEFFNEIERYAKTKGHCVVPFSWSGKPTDNEIRAGGAMLAKLIESYPVSEHIILIGHSHGGNVINHASKLLYDPLEKLLADMAHKPVSDVFAEACAQIAAHPSLTNLNYASVPEAQLHWWDLLPTLRYFVLPESKALASGKKRYLIEKVYLLGTPTSTTSFAPQMEIVGELINLFSYGDYIQPVLGMYQRTYPKHERLINLEVITWDHVKKTIQKPGHHEIHAPEIGRWLLAIPDDVKLLGQGSFEKFKFGIDAKIVFRLNGAPEFMA